MCSVFDFAENSSWWSDDSSLYSEAIQRNDKFTTPSAIEILSREPLEGGDHGLLSERLLGECGEGGNSEFVMES